MFLRKQLRCSFCRKNESEIAKLVAGPKVYICDQCIAAAHSIIENASDDNQPPKTKSSVRQLLTRVRGLVFGRDARRVSSVTLSEQKL